MQLRYLFFTSAAVLFLTAAPIAAQDANIEGRVKKLEKEMQAVQRQVFPNGAGRFFEPDIKNETEEERTNANPVSTSATSDLLSRVDAIEAQLAELTGQVEQQSNNMRLMEQRLKAVEAGLKKQQADIAAAAAQAAESAPETPTIRSAAASVPTPAPKNPPAKAPASTPAKAPATPAASAARTKAVAAIVKPSSGDAFDDGYNYGFRLWEAKFYPEAQAQLADTVKKFPKHPRASYARNLLGRAWLDDKKPASAVKILYDNYKEDPRGDRAPDSLYFLGVALTDLGKAAEACEAFGQLKSAYPDVVAERLADRVASARTRAKCK